MAKKKKKVPRIDPKLKQAVDADEMRPHYDLDYSKARLNTVKPLSQPAITKIISIADACRDGCQLHVLAERFQLGGMTDPHFISGVLLGQESRYKAALKKIAKVCEAAHGEGNFRLITIIRDTVVEALN